MLDVTRVWYRPRLNWVAILLLPFSWLFALIVGLRRSLYHLGIIKTVKFSKPVIVVGNIAVGGTGKTPLVIQLVHFLRSRGFTPGIVSRGYGGKRGKLPYWVRHDSLAAVVGDEALVLSRATQCPMVVAADRVAAVKTLLHGSDCDIVIADDGLQHYRMGRDIEIVVIDGERRFGNQQFMPAGPLREAKGRLKQVDLVVVNGGDALIESTMQLQQGNAISMSGKGERPLSAFKRVHAVAGIGHPERFFNALRAAGMEVIPHVFSDHHRYVRRNFRFKDDLPILMTEKDAVKCESFIDERYWYVPVVARLDERILQRLLLKLDALEE